MDYQLLNKKSKKQYEFHIDEHTPRIEYIKAQDKIYLTHTEVPKALEGKGIGSAIIKAALEDVKSQGLTLSHCAHLLLCTLKSIRNGRT